MANRKWCKNVYNYLGANLPTLNEGNDTAEWLWFAVDKNTLH